MAQTSLTQIGEWPQRHRNPQPLPGLGTDRISGVKGGPSQLPNTDAIYAPPRTMGGGDSPE